MIFLEKMKKTKKIWHKCKKCRGTGIKKNSLMIEPLRYQICDECSGTGWILNEENERE